MRNNLIYGAFSAVCLGAWPVLAFDDPSADFSSGWPVSQQNKTISSWDIGLRLPTWDLAEGRFGFSARTGSLKLDNESGTRLGVGAYWEREFGDFTFALPVGVLWLDKAVYGRNEVTTKNYGGELQFTYGAEVGYRVAPSWHVFYRFEHMSNGQRYEFNPALDSHNFGFRITF